MIRDLHLEGGTRAGSLGPFRQEEVEEGRPAALAFQKYLTLRPRIDAVAEDSDPAGPRQPTQLSAVRLLLEEFRAEHGGRWHESVLVHDGLRMLRWAREFLSYQGTLNVMENGMGFSREWNAEVEDEGDFVRRELETQRERLVLQRLAAYEKRLPSAPLEAKLLPGLSGRDLRRSPRRRSRRRILMSVLPRVIDLIDSSGLSDSHIDINALRVGGGFNNHTATRPTRRQRRRNKRRLRDEIDRVPSV